MFIWCLEGEKHSQRIIIQAIKYYSVNIKEALEQMVGNQLHFILYTICVNHSYCTKHEYTCNSDNNTIGHFHFFFFGKYNIRVIFTLDEVKRASL